MAGADWPGGVARIVLDTVDSTSREIARRAPDAPTWVLAHAQTEGRGRRGRGWTVAPGNFAASLGWRPEVPPAQMALRSFTASLALHDALAGLGVRDLSLKWPNDVLLGEGKLAGILLEVPAPGLLVVGIGVNLAAAPAPGEIEPGALRPVSLLAETGVRVAPEVFLDRLAPAFAAREAQLVTEGFAATRADWLRHAARLGQAIAVRLPTETLEGTFEDIDNDGQLVLGTPRGGRRIAAGDVFFGRVPAEGARCS